MLSNPSLLLEKNSHLLEGQTVLILNHESDTFAKSILSEASQVTTLALDYHHYLQLEPHRCAQLTCHFGHQLAQQQLFDTVIIYYPKAKPLTGYLVNLAARHLKAGGQLLIVGENKGGVRSIPKQLPSYFSPAFKQDNARHCILFTAELIAAAPEIDLQDWLTRYQLDTPQGPLTICNLVGVFSEKRLDAGTALLLANLPTLNGRVLDFGCGAGVLAAALLKAQPQLSLECVDINAMALASCQITLAENGLSAKVYASDGLSQCQGKFDAIISNPPFHDGLVSTTNIATQFVSDSKQQLRTGGELHLVANRHLPYSDAIASHFGQVNVTAENNKYKVYANKNSG
ncbi:methyltransferase [Shewanella waksmanii]|uniref:methyltransferase n=1 Tax=Shewanella waksmanii TaxID=213783 RepID=UPI003735EC1C